MDANADIEQKTVNYLIPLWMAEMRSSYYMRQFYAKGQGINDIITGVCETDFQWLSGLSRCVYQIHECHPLI